MVKILMKNEAIADHKTNFLFPYLGYKTETDIDPTIIPSSAPIVMREVFQPADTSLSKTKATLLYILIISVFRLHKFKPLLRPAAQYIIKIIVSILLSLNGILFYEEKEDLKSKSITMIEKFI